MGHRALPLTTGTSQARPAWLSACGAEGLDPGEVRLVLGRYRAYQGYYASGRRGTPLPLASWFNWYRLEAASEHGEQAPSPSGCSVDDDARNIFAFVEPMIDKATKSLAINRDDDIVAATLLTADGAIVHPSFAPKPAAAGGQA